jgi:hypothetical protein
VIVALLSFYDEPPALLGACVASLRFCDHVVALDGAYRLLAGGSASSGPEQHAAITETAEALGIGFTLHVPPDRWLGNEVEKRSRLFEAGRLVAREPTDWFLVIDADMAVVSYPPDLRARLEEADVDVATVSLREGLSERVVEEVASHVPIPTRGGRPHRQLFRALPGLRVEGNHFTYLAERDGETVMLWGNQPGLEEEPCLGIPDLVVAHRPNRRSAHRMRQQRAYYELRDQCRIEARDVYVEGVDGQPVKVAR